MIAKIAGIEEHGREPGSLGERQVSGAIDRLRSAKRLSGLERSNSVLVWLGREPIARRAAGIGSIWAQNLRTLCSGLARSDKNQCLPRFKESIS